MERVAETTAAATTRIRARRDRAERRRDPLGAVSGALLLVWLGLVMLASNFGMFDRWSEPVLDGSLWLGGHQLEANAFAVFFFGAGAIVLAEILIRLCVPKYRAPLVGSFVVSAVFLGCGIGFGFGTWALIAPLILVAVGLGILSGGRIFQQAD